jgi:hypothetical protein
VSRRTRAWYRLQASKAEALIAVDFYNTTGERRSLEGFVVHMHLAWLYLLQAEFERDDTDYRHWKVVNNRRVLDRIDGEPKSWGLRRSIQNRWTNELDPVRKNLEFFVGLRNKIEHRYQDSIGIAVAGHAQAMLLNYETELTSQFGNGEGLADRLRFPVFLSSITPEGIDAIRHVRSKIPSGVASYIRQFHEGLGGNIAESQQFEFRVHLVPRTGPKTDADMAITFVRVEDLDPATLADLEAGGQTGLIAVRTRLRPVQNLGRHKPADVVREVATRVPGFKMGRHTAKWKEHRARPDSGAEDPSATDERYCVWDEPHRDYLYTDAWIEKLVREDQSQYDANQR